MPQAREADIDRAVAAARQAFNDPSGWANWESSRRADAIERPAHQLEIRAEEMARRVSSQNGMPIPMPSRSAGIELTQQSYCNRAYFTAMRNYAQTEIAVWSEDCLDPTVADHPPDRRTTGNAGQTSNSSTPTPRPPRSTHHPHHTTHRWIRAKVWG